MVELKNVSKSYLGSGKNALNGVSFSFGPGEIIGLFGENGAGKTTLLKAILGFIKYDGEIMLDGEKITRKNIARLSFATCEHSFFPRLTANEHRDFYKQHFSRFNDKRYNGLMDFFELPRNKNVGSFSTGQQNQFEIIMALSQGADYILMDEPFAGNDIFNREDFYRLLAGILEPSETIIIATHLIEEISGFIDRAVLISKGKIIGDKTISQLDDEGVSLIDYIKNTYHYKADRVSEALESITAEEKQ